MANEPNLPICKTLRGSIAMRHSGAEAAADVIEELYEALEGLVVHDKGTDNVQQWAKKQGVLIEAALAALARARGEP